MNLFHILLGACLALPVAGVGAQTPPTTGTRTQVAGNLTAVDANTGQVSLRTDKGDVITLSASEKTVIVHVPPGETDVRKGSRMALSSLGAGDRVVAFIRQAADGNAAVTSMVVRTKADLAQSAEKELEDWKKRGTTGTVAAVDPEARTITLKTGRRTVTLETSDKTEYRRYSPDSAKPADATPGSFAEIKPGDQVNALGDRNEAGTSVKAERIYAGTFRQLAVTVLSVDAGAGEVKVKDLASKKPLTIVVTGDTKMKKLPEMMARMLARRYQGGGQAAAPGSAPRNFDIRQMLERAPAATLSELKAGDALMVSTTMGSDPARVTAIMVLAGVEPLLTASASSTRDVMAGWNLGGGAAEEATQ